MEGITILGTKYIMDGGISHTLLLIIGILLVALGVMFLILYNENMAGGILCVGGATIFLATLLYILIPVKVHMATIEDNVPYKYIEEHYIVKEKVEDLYILIPKGDTTDE